MKINKKVISLVAALAIAIPMSVSFGSINSVFAESIKPALVDESSNPLGGVTLAFYQASNPIKKIFTVRTKADGKFDINSVISSNGFSTKGIVDAEGNLVLPEGDYFHVDKIVPAGYARNLSPEKFSVIGENSTSDIARTYSKLPEGKGQLVVQAVDSSSNPVEGATLELSKLISGKFVVVGELSTNEVGYVTNASPSPESNDANLDTTNGVLTVSNGTYKVVPKNAPNNLKPDKEELSVIVQTGKVNSLLVTYKNGGNNTNPGQDDNTKEKVTGLRIMAVNVKDNNKPVANQEIAVYNTDDNGQQKDLIFVGKTNSDGIFEIGKISKGVELLSSENGVLLLEPGKYYFKQNKVGATLREAYVKKDEITKAILPLEPKTISGSGNKSGGSSTGSNTNNIKKSTLAKTGVASSLGYIVAGTSMISGGAYMLRKKK